jgi:alpha-L-rhamnosidase
VRRYVGADGRLSVRTQTAYVLALRFDLLVDAEHRRTAEEDLIANVERVGHLQTGFLGTPHLLEALTDAGRVDLAYALLEREEQPSWLYPVTRGATTIWERWDGWTEASGFHPSQMNSFNHYAYGAVGEWLYRVVAGIDVDPDRGAGFRRVRIRPHPGGSLTSASARVETHRGPIETSWSLADGAAQLQVAVPPNTTATIEFPTANEAAVTESGLRLADVDGIHDVGIRRGRVACTARAGAYAFEIAGAQ